MRVPKVDKFLFVFHLNIGGYVISSISIALSFIFISAFSYYMAQIVFFYNSQNPSDQEFFRNVFVGEGSLLKEENASIILSYL
jgi:hypothetical protein